MNQKILFVLLVLAICLGLSFGKVENDLVTELPGVNGTLPYIYSGYLNFTSLVNDTTRHFHYVLVEKITGTAPNAPLIIWTNGSPGCSSMEGLFSQIGPYLIPDAWYTINGTSNENSWATVANLLFIDAIAGTGYSYDKNDPNPVYNDFNLAQDSQLAIQTFFQLYPELKTCDLYLAGQGYAGRQVPQLAYWLLSNASTTVNLKGILVGNGYTDDETLLSSSIKYAADHSLFSTDLQNLTYQACQQDYFAPSCFFTVSEWAEISKYQNPFNIYSKCYNTSAWARSSNSEFTANLKTYEKHTSRYSRAPWAMLNQVKQQERLASGYSDWTAQSEDPPCIWDLGLYNYMNNVSVKIELHVNSQIEYVICNRTILDNYDFRFYNGSYWLLPELREKGLKILFYYGDSDSVVPYNNFYEWYPKINSTAPTKAWRAWYPTSSKTSMVDVGGFVTEWDNFWMVTLRNSGQMGPHDKPSELLYLLSSFLKGKEL